MGRLAVYIQDEATDRVRRTYWVYLVNVRGDVLNLLPEFGGNKGSSAGRDAVGICDGRFIYLVRPWRYRRVSGSYPGHVGALRGLRAYRICIGLDHMDLANPHAHYLRGTITLADAPV